MAKNKKTVRRSGGEDMPTEKFVYWKDGNFWLGYLEEYPDYMTQGETLEELKINLVDIFKEISGGEIPNVRKVAELEIS